MLRKDKRKANQIRKIKITKNYLRYPYGSVLIECGNTKVICAATVQENVPEFLKGTNSGWITAEYSMLPQATQERTSRTKLLSSGRTREIQRIIGRALRAAVDLNKLGPRTIFLDCDVIQADGGTRTTAINGSFVALWDTCKKLLKEGKIDSWPIKNCIAAVSVGIVNSEKVVDLSADEDAIAEVDMNIVMTDRCRFIEIQGTAEQKNFTRKDLWQLLNLATKACQDIFKIIKAKIKT